MSHADRVEQERIADLWLTIKPPDAPKASRRERAKNFGEAVGIGWFIGRVWHMFTN